MVPLMWCPAGLLGTLLCCTPVGASCCLLGSVVLFDVLEWALLVLSFSRFAVGSSFALCGFPPPAVRPVWCPGPVT